jgi:RND family efflux transporter MFP subunit
MELSKKTIVFMIVTIASLYTQVSAQEALPKLPLLSSNDCIIEPHKTVNISSPVEGIVKQVSVERGDFIKKNQTVVKLDSRVEWAAVDLAKEQANYNQRKVKRNKVLYAKKLISLNEKDELETESFLSRLELKQARAVLSQRTITSPINGIVVERYLGKGEFVGSDPILKIAQLNPLNIEVILPIDAFGKVTKGMQAKILPQLPIGGEYAAKVVIVDRVVDAASGTIGVRLELPNPKNRLPAGIKCRVEFESPS